MPPIARDFIDLDRYPIDRSGSGRAALIDEARAAIDSVGCAVLKGFVCAERIADLVAECDRIAQHGHRNFNRTNPYFTQDRPDLPSSHPLRRFYDRSLIRSLRLEPGDLQIFKGRYSLHRVTPLSGPRLRYVAIFSFAEEPGMVGSPERTRQLYGRVLPIHLERAGLRADTLID